MAPFISTSTPNVQGLECLCTILYVICLCLTETKQGVQDQATPRRVLSPLKKFNRVAPATPGKITPLKLGEEENTPLKSSSASLLEQKGEAKLKKQERPDSAPHKRQQMPIDVNVVIKSNESGATGKAQTAGSLDCLL